MSRSMFVEQKKINFKFFRTQGFIIISKSFKIYQKKKHFVFEGAVVDSSIFVKYLRNFKLFRIHGFIVISKSFKICWTNQYFLEGAVGVTEHFC